MTDAPIADWDTKYRYVFWRQRRPKRIREEERASEGRGCSERGTLNADRKANQIKEPVLFNSTSLLALATERSQPLIRELLCFNNDGIVDLAFGFTSASPPLRVALGKGDGAFQNAFTIPYTTSFPDPAIVVRADFNEDGVSDLAAIGKPMTKHPGYGTLLTQSAAAVDVSGIAPQGSGTHQVVARYWSDNDFISSVSKLIELSGLTAAPGGDPFDAGSAV